MDKDLKRITKRIEKLLKEEPGLRDNDKLLWLTYNNIYNNWSEKYGAKFYNIIEKLILDSDTPIFESVSRARRIIQERNNSLAGEKFKRIKEAESVRKWVKDN
jgi:hypothetical protein